MKRIIKDMIIASLLSGAIISGFNAGVTLVEAYESSSQLHELNKEEHKLLTAPETSLITKRLEEIKEEKQSLASKNYSAKFGANVLATTLLGSAGTIAYLKKCYQDEYIDENENTENTENSIN